MEKSCETAHIQHQLSHVINSPMSIPIGEWFAEENEELFLISYILFLLFLWYVILFSFLIFRFPLELHMAYILVLIDNWICFMLDQYVVKGSE